MKKIIILSTAAMMVSTGAMASKARLQSLGEDKDGSYYISDTRNVYINPAELNTFGNRVFMEWGSNGTALTGNATLDADNAPKAQGGMFYELSNGFKTGVILGDETDVAALTRILASNGGTTASSGFMQTADNVVDLFLAGKGSVNWGANLLYTGTKNETSGSRYDQHAYAVRLGASQGAWNAHALIALGAKADAPDNTAAPTYKGKLGIRVGGGYDLSPEIKSFGMFEKYAWDQGNNTTSTREGSFSKAILGFGHTKKVSDSSTLYTKVQGELVNVKLATSTGNTVEAKITRLALPIVIGFEHQSTEWLTLRGSVNQNIYGTVKDSGLKDNFADVPGGGPTSIKETIRYLANQRYGSSVSGNGGKKTIANSTAVNAGMTLKFGKLELDGNIGATSASRTDTTPSTTVGSGTNKGVLAFDNLETRVGMTYNF